MRYNITFVLASLGASIAAAPALAAVPQVVTDIPPVQSLVAQVMGDLGAPVLLLEKGADEHDFQLRPSQMGAIAGADLVVWVGPDLTPWLARAMGSAQGQSLILLNGEGTILRQYDEDASTQDAVAEAEDGHSHDGIDPHAWLNPQNALVWLDLIAADLSRLDPENAATYARNAETAKADVAALDADLAAELADFSDKGFVTFHAAYGYFNARYGLKDAASLALGDATTPGAARLTALQDALRAGVYDCAFPEVQHEPALLQQVLEGSATRLGGALDPVGSSLDPGPAAYATLMRALADTLTDCLAP